LLELIPPRIPKRNCALAEYENASISMLAMVIRVLIVDIFSLTH
jgi:hypothetical protein